MMREDTMVVKELVEAIEKLLPCLNTEDKRKPQIYFDFAGFGLGSIDSWRGVYSHLSIQPMDDTYGKEVSVSAFLKRLKAVEGQTFTGYKGGEFKMCLETPIWVDYYGKYTSTAIVGVQSDGYNLIVNTQNKEYVADVVDHKEMIASLKKQGII